LNEPAISTQPPTVSPRQPLGGVHSGNPGRHLTLAFAAIAVALVLVRFHSFRPFLDEPHAFRQAWTSSYALEFYRFDMNILRPSIPAMGDYRHILIEFPLCEWMTALVYHATGPTLLVDRLVSIAFFLGSACFLFWTIALVQDRLMAWVATLVYMSAPLGIYYSRAVHIDSATLCFGHALLYYFVRYGQTGRRGDLVRAFLASALGFLVKAPYVFYLILPALVLQPRDHRRRAVLSVLTFGAALAVGLAWYSYAQSMNRAAPDLSFIRGYETAADNLDFYVGAIGRRLNGEEWATILTRLRREIAVEVWWVLVPLALIWCRRLSGLVTFAAVWTIGSLVFLVLFFAANSMHNYYQLNFMAPFALWMAIPLYACVTAEGRARGLLRALALASIVAYAAMGVRFAVRNYYWIDELGMRVGEFVRFRTTERDLVIMAFNDAYYLDPRYLYYATRRGWSIHAAWLEPRAIEGLRPHGATAVVTSDLWSPPESTVRYLEGLRLIDVLEIGDKHVFLHRLD
jgi:hypothetical protein